MTMKTKTFTVGRLGQIKARKMSDVHRKSLLGI